MKNTIGMGVAAALLAGCMVTAQSSSSPSPGSQREPSPGGQRDSSSASSQQSSKSVTVTGCVQSAGASGAASTTSPASPAAGASSGGDRFILANAKMSSGSGAAAGGAAGGAAAGGAAGAGAATSAGGGSTYQLEGKSAEVKPHLNHEVEITGRLESASASATSSSRDAGATSTRSATSGQQELHVESVRMISATCSK